MFAQTDFARQKLMLRESLLEMLLFVQSEAGRSEIERLAEQHRQLNVHAAHYDLWLDALCEALARHDSKFNSDLELMWRDAMRKGISVMSASSSTSEGATAS